MLLTCHSCRRERWCKHATSPHRRIVTSVINSGRFANAIRSGLSGLIMCVSGQSFAALSPAPMNLYRFQAPRSTTHPVCRYSCPCGHNPLMASIALTKVDEKVIPMIRILIAEPITLTREGLAALFARESDIELAAPVKHREQVVSTARAVRPHVAVLAATFPDRDGITVAAGLHA